LRASGSRLPPDQSSDATAKLPPWRSISRAVRLTTMPLAPGAGDGDGRRASRLVDLVRATMPLKLAPSGTVIGQNT
jgi:hypothetical protein